MSPQLISGSANFSAQPARHLDGAVNILNVPTHVAQLFAAVRAGGHTASPACAVGHFGRRVKLLLPGDSNLTVIIVFDEDCLAIVIIVFVELRV